jgi:hypothetical protein
MATIQMSVRPEDLSQVPRGGADSRAGDPGDLWRVGRPDQAQAAAGAVSPAAERGCCRRSLRLWAWRGGRWATSLRRICARGSSSLAAWMRATQAGRVCEAHQLLPAQLRRSGDYAGLKAELDRIARKRALAATGSSTWPRRRSFSPASSRTWARRAWRSRSRARWPW